MEDKIKEEIEIERYEALSVLEEWLELPVIILRFIWLIIFIMKLAWEPKPYLEVLGTLKMGS